MQYFNWQVGYGAFSISVAGVSNIAKYIENQDKHHQKRSFQEEDNAFLNQYNAEID